MKMRLQDDTCDLDLRLMGEHWEQLDKYFRLLIDSRISIIVRLMERFLFVN